MTLTEQIITVAAVVVATMLTRFLPFILIGNKRETPPYIKYLGKVLPCAVFAMLIVYCLRNVDLSSSTHALPEILSIALTVAVHIFRRQMLLSIASGTIFYMALVQFVFATN